MVFKGWRKTSLIEYPGRLATVLFSGGCNFRCPYCYNPDLVLNPEKLADIPAAEVLAFLAENRHLYEAVMVTGGEPTLKAELPDFLAACRRLGLLTGLETNGSAPGMLARLLAAGALNYVAMDVKAPLSFARYRAAAGLPDSAAGRSLLRRVRESIRLLLHSGVEVEFRTTLTAGLHGERDVALMAAALRGAGRYVLQPFIPGRTLDPAFHDAEPWPEERLLRLAAELAPRFPACEVRNMPFNGEKR
jgi:pyruvate formate lyase activating enzyme